MAITNLKGRQVVLYLDKAGTMTRFACADNVSLSVNTEEIQITSDCEDSEAEDAPSFKDYDDGDIDWSGSISGNVRRIEGTDVAGNFSAEELMDLQLSRTKLLMRFSLGSAEGAARYGGTIFFTQNQLTGGSSNTTATFSANFRGKGALTKTLAPAA